MNYISRFLSQVSRTPDITAVSDENQELTYAELARRAGSLAALLRGKGLADGDFVGVLLPRTLDIVVAAIASMRSGGVYMPMDSAYPEERLRYMLKDSGAKIVITTRKLLEEKFGKNAPEAILIDETALPDESYDASPTPDSPSYLLYTSGTTGNPKGVLHTHRSLLALAEQKLGCRFDSTGVVAGFTFIASVHMMLPPLLEGGRCTIVPDYAKSDMYSLYDYVAKKGIRQLFLPASLAASMAEEFDFKGVTIFSAGEKLRTFTPKGDCRVINVYGSTEGVVVLGWAVRGDETDIPIGIPYPGISTRLVDENFKDVPKGEAGELIYSGDIMAQRYLNLEEQTNAKWMIVSGKRWYRTGDRLKMDEEGRYHYLGRVDNMVKIRGFRVETGEVEGCIRIADTAIKDAVVVLRCIHGIDHLCCYYTSSAAVDLPALKEKIAGKLAEYMLPDIWVPLEDFPRNANGKIMRSSLPEPPNPAEALSAIYSEVEMRVEEAARVALGLDIPVDIDESFLDLGGDSIRAMKLSAMLLEQGIRISGAQVLRIKVLREIASAAEVDCERLWTPMQQANVRNRFARRGESIQKVLPLDSRQDDMLYEVLFFPDRCAGRSIYVLGTSSNITAEELSDAVSKVSAQNEFLRSAVVFQGVSVFQQVITDRKVPSSVFDLSEYEDEYEGLFTLCERLKRAPSDPEGSPAMEVVFAGDGKDGCLVFKVEHLNVSLPQARKGIAGVLGELSENHPDDALLSDWYEIMQEALEIKDKSAGAKRINFKNQKYKEIAVYSDHPDKKKVVFVHTGNSGSDAYYALADKIGGECSFSVIEPFNLYNPSQAIDGIKGIASKYVEILRRHQPEGPYFVGGWCYGGVVAHEMACQLQAMGEKVEHLVMLDSHVTIDKETKHLFGQMASQIKREYFETSPLFADLRNQGLLESVVANSLRASRNLAEHEPSVFDGEVTYFKPQVTPAGLSGDSLRYWQEMMKYKAGGYENYCTSIKVIPTPHEHDLMMDKESLDIIVPEILKCIKDE